MFTTQTLVALILTAGSVDHCQKFGDAKPKPNAAEKLFRDCEKKLLDAKSVEIAIEAIDKDKGSLRSTLVATDGNKFAMEFGFYLNDGKSLVWKSVSDGVKIRSSCVDCGRELNTVDFKDAPKDFNATLIDFTLRGGMLGIACFYRDVPKDGMLTVTVSDFAMGPMELVNGRQAQRIDFQVAFREKNEAKVVGKSKLWLDTATGLPVKRETKLKADGEEFGGAGMWTVRLNEKIDAKVFRLPPEE